MVPGQCNGLTTTILCSIMRSSQYNFSHLLFWKHTENILARLFVPYMSFSDVLYFPHKNCVFAEEPRPHGRSKQRQLKFRFPSAVLHNCSVDHQTKPDRIQGFFQPHEVFVLVSCIRVIIMDPLRVVYWFPTRDASHVVHCFGFIS